MLRCVRCNLRSLKLGVQPWAFFENGGHPGHLFFSHPMLLLLPGVSKKKSMVQQIINIIRMVTHNNVIFSDIINNGAKVIDRDSNMFTRQIREAIHIRQRGAKSINWGEGAISVNHVYNPLLKVTVIPLPRNHNKFHGKYSGSDHL